MQWIDRQRLKTDVLAGTFLNLGSPTSAEIAARAGFDWLLLDMEHGSGSQSDLRHLLHAVQGSNAAPIVRISSVDADLAKFVLDSGAAGIMFPFVSSAEDARRAVEICKYPPVGRRGVAGIIRATEYGKQWKSYFHSANSQTLVVVQIETVQGLEAAGEIAAVDGVDVLFVGPLDLSVSLGTPGDFTSDVMQTALKRVLQACADNGCCPGILSRPELVSHHRELGFRLLALGSDTGAVVSGLAQSLAAIRRSDSD